MKPDHMMLEHLATRMRNKLGLDLFGIDVIIENHTGRYAVIDINSFPGLLAMLGTDDNILDV